MLSSCQIEFPFYFGKIKCDYRYIILPNERLTLRDLFERHVKKSGKFIKIFLTTEGYRDYLDRVMDGYRQHKFKMFHHDEYPTDQLAIFRPPGKFMYKDDVLKAKKRPILLSNFQHLPGYKQKEITKEDLPTLMTPDLLIIEFFPYIEDENKILDKILEWLKSKDEISIKQFIDIKNYINYLKNEYERKSSKLDYLLGYLATLKNLSGEFMDILQSKILHQSIVPNINDIEAREGFYIVRLNGEIKIKVYFVKYKFEEYYTFPPGATEAIIKFSEYKNYYYNDNDKHVQITKPYLHFTFTNISMFQSNNHSSLMIPLEVKKKTKILFRIYVYKKRVFFNQKHQRNILFNYHSEEDNKGCVRVCGKKVITIFA